VVAPDYEETPGGDPLEHAAGKARSVEGGERPVLGVDTVVLCEGRVIGKPADAGDAERMLEYLAGKTHDVVSGLCLRTPGWEELHSETTRVTFRELTPRDLGHYLASGEWEGRAGSYAIQGLGASLVERVEGDYLNVVGLPGGLLVRLLAQRFPGAYGFG
jgi:septum formation protein